MQNYFIYSGALQIKNYFICIDSNYSISNP